MSQIQRWDGAALKEGATIRRWTGTEFTRGARVKQWNGSAFTPSDGPAPVYAANMNSGVIGDYFPVTSGNAALSADAAHTGSHGLRITPVTGTGGSVATSTVKWAQTFEWASLRFHFRLNALDPVSSNSMDIMTLQRTTDQLNNFDFFRSGVSGNFRYDMEGASAFYDTGIVPVVGKWYCLEAVVFYGGATQLSYVRLSGKAFPVLECPLQTPRFVRSLHFGTSSTARNYSLDIDNVAVAVSNTRPNFINGGAPA